MKTIKVNENKYNKVNQQQKYHLLNLIYKYKHNVRQAAQTVGINYLTAKTIVFFYKKHYKSYQFAIQHKHQMNKYAVTASYANIRKVNTISQQLIKPKLKIQVICSIGNILNPLKETKKPTPTSTQRIVQLKSGNMVFEDEKVEQMHFLSIKLSQQGCHTSEIHNNLQQPAIDANLMIPKCLQGMQVMKDFSLNKSINVNI